MNSLAKWGMAAAVVVVVAIVGYNLLPGRGGSGSQPVGAAASPSASSQAASARPSPVVGGVCTPTPVRFDASTAIDLTGAWAGDDGGIYYVRQLDKVIWWNGMSGRDDPSDSLGRGWNNVGRGEIKDDLTIAADWADVPRGMVDGYGTVNFKIGADAQGNLQVTKTSETGTGRDDTTWTRCEPGFPAG